jgi:2-methylcitrate dehydratase PrpD
MTSSTRTKAGPSARAAAFVSEAAYRNIPVAAIARLKLCLLDAIGCAIYGATVPWGQILSDYVIDQGGLCASSIWGRGDRVPPAMAALVNGTLIHGFELDDLHKTPSFIRAVPLFQPRWHYRKFSVG